MKICALAAIAKPKGMSSSDVVVKCRGALSHACGERQKCGHMGTLDPMAEGVLPVCIGSAARVSEYLDLDFKTYRCRLRFGQVTDTLDIWGKLLEERETGGLTESAIREALSSFKGLCALARRPFLFFPCRLPFCLHCRSGSGHNTLYVYGICYWQHRIR